MVISFLLYNHIFNFLLEPYETIANSRPGSTLGDGRLLQVDPLEGFGIRMKLAAYGGIAIAMPVILWQLWRFITPGLYAHEKRYAIPFLAERAVPLRARSRPRLLHACPGRWSSSSTSAGRTTS